MDDIEQFSRALNAIAQAGAYSAKDIRQVCTQEVQCEETVLWADNIPYAVIRTPTVPVPVYERSSDIQEKDCRPNSKLDMSISNNDMKPSKDPKSDQLVNRMQLQNRRQRLN